MDLIKHAREEKNRAMDERDLGNWDAALEILGAVKSLLEEALQASPDPELRSFETSAKKQLYQLLGSIGGVYRRRAASADMQPGDLAAAATYYDEGLLIEQEFVDSYNLTQRLVVRTLINPGAPALEHASVEGVLLRDALRRASETIKQQTAPTGPRSNDEYAFADQMVVSTILGEPNWFDSAEEFARLASNSSYARQATREVLEALFQATAALEQDNPFRARVSEALRKLA